MARSLLRPFERLLFGNPLYGLTLGGRSPDRLALVPPDPWSGDPDVGKAVLDGEYHLAGQWLSLGDDPWSHRPEQDRTAAALHGFAWLSDLRALGSTAARDRARELVSAWIERHERWSQPAWRPDVLGSRLTGWLAAGDFLLNDADPAFRSVFLSACATQAKHLGRVWKTTQPTACAFDGARGLIYAGLCLPARENLLSDGRSLLEREIERQVLPDVGHYQRNPAQQLSVLRVLCDIRTALLTARAEVPPSLLGAIDRMTPMLRALRLGDGGLALFNGGWEEDPRLIDTVLSQAGVPGQAVPCLL